MKITSIDRCNHQILSDAFVKALKGVCDQYGVDVEGSGGTLGSGTGVIKLSVNVRDNGAGVAGKQAEWDRFCAWIDMKPEDFGREFTWRGQRYRIVGVLRGGHKYNLSADRVYDGRSFKFVASHVKTLLPQVKRAA